MRSAVRRKLEMAARVRQFSQTHPSSEPGYATLLGSLVDRLARAEVIAAVPVDDELRTRISSALGEKLGAAVQTEVRQDPTILGGLIIRIGDRVIDTSVRTRLQQLQMALL